MSRKGLRQRTACWSCRAACQTMPQEIQWRDMRARRGEWVWLARHLCPSCRANAREFWFGRRDEQPRARQLVLLSDADAPIDLDADWRFRRTRPGYRKWLASPWNTA